MSRPPVGSTGTLEGLQVEPGDVVRFHYPGMNPGDPRVVDSIRCGRYYMTDGALWEVVRTPFWVLISRANPDQPAHIITHEGRQYDLTALETPFGLLPEPVQEALKAWPHGWVHYCGSQGWQSLPHYTRIRAPRVYRAVPAPAETRVRCYRSAPAVPFNEYGTCIKNPDGSIDWASWEDAE